MTELVMMAAVALAGVDVGLASVLLAMYLRMYRNVRAPLTVGLAVFAGFFVVQSLVALLSYVAMLPIIPDEFAPFLVGIMALETGGLVFLASATRM